MRSNHLIRSQFNGSAADTLDPHLVSEMSSRKTFGLRNYTIDFSYSETAPLPWRSAAWSEDSISASLSPVLHLLELTTEWVPLKDTVIWSGRLGEALDPQRSVSSQVKSEFIIRGFIPVPSSAVANRNDCFCHYIQFLSQWLSVYFSGEFGFNVSSIFINSLWP